MTQRAIKVIACATVIEEMRPLVPPGVATQVLDFGLHIQPAVLKSVLQEAIDATDGVDAIVLGYGLCSMAVVGLSAKHAALVVPRVDDCISIFLGSREAHRQQMRQEPGTYYLTKGWIEVADTPFDEYDRMVKSYGPERAKRIMDIYLRNYTRLALINTGQDGMDHYRDHSRRTAERFGLRFEEIPGSNALIRKMIDGPWDEQFVVVQPGETITLGHFYSETPLQS